MLKLLENHVKGARPIFPTFGDFCNPRKLIEHMAEKCSAWKILMKWCLVRPNKTNCLFPVTCSQNLGTEGRKQNYLAKNVFLWTNKLFSSIHIHDIRLQQGNQILNNPISQLASKGLKSIHFQGCFDIQKLIEKNINTCWLSQH